MNLNQKLSEHFTLREFINSQTARRMGIPNIPDERIVLNLGSLCTNVLEPLRIKYGKPLFITSGYRSKVLNIILKGSKTSRHPIGEAADIDIGENNVILFTEIYKHLPFDQLIWEFGTKTNPDWIHVSYKRLGENRRQVLRTIQTESGIHTAKTGFPFA
jgi:hypothetical protein